MKKIIYLTIILWLAFFGQATAQNFSRLSAAFNVGANILQGDNDINATSIGMNAKLGPQFRIADPLSLNLMFGIGNMNGSRETSNFRIQKMNYKCGELVLSVNLLSFIQDSPVEFRLNAGAGLIGYKVITINFNTDDVIANYPNNKDLYYLGGFTFGYKLNDHLTATLDMTAQRSNSDKLDGYVCALPNDWFSIINLGAKYSFSDITQKSDNKTKASTYNSNSDHKKAKCPRRRSKFYYYIKNRTLINRWDLLG